MKSTRSYRARGGGERRQGRLDECSTIRDGGTVRNATRGVVRCGSFISQLRRGLLVNDAWIADRMRSIEASGIRKAFDMSKTMKDPINLSIGLPDFDVAAPVKSAACAAIEEGRNAYTVTQGIPELR